MRSLLIWSGAAEITLFVLMSHLVMPENLPSSGIRPDDRISEALGFNAHALMTSLTTYLPWALILGCGMVLLGVVMHKPTVKSGSASPKSGNAKLVKALPPKSAEPTNEELAEPVEPEGILSDVDVQPQWQQPPRRK